MQPSEEIKNKLDIVDFIKDYIQLTPAGMNFRARCPFHNEKSPSFMVSPDKQIWHCFGCGKGGDIFKFIMELEGIEFVEALRILAPKAGVNLKRQDPREASERMRLLDIVEISRRFYHNYLLDSPDAKSAREYLAKRGLDKGTIEEWQIGYSPEAWDGLLKELKKQGYNEREIEKTGMIIEQTQRKSFFDRFRGRIMFPINDANGNAVAFTARVSPEREATEQMGKYVNSPQTVLYNKSQTIFALDRAKQAIKQNDQVIIMEGQMDAITAHQFGYRNVVASSGTALTKEQIAMLKRFTSNFALAFDVDDAGHMAADRGIRETLKQNINVTVIEVPNGKDPDQCIRENKNSWDKALENAKHMMMYYFDRTFASLDLSKIEGRRTAAAKLLPIIASMENNIEKSHWLKALAESIGVDEGVLREALQENAKNTREYRRDETPSPLEPYKKVEISREGQLSELFLAILMKFFELIDFSMQSMQVEIVKGDYLRDIYKYLILFYNSSRNNKDNRNASKPFDLNDFKAFLENSPKKAIIDKSAERLNYENLNDQLAIVDKLVLLGDKEYFDYDFNSAKAEMIRIIILLKKAFLGKKMKDIEARIARSESSNDEKTSRELMKELKLLSDEFRELTK